ncbi:MAG: two-component system response regulator [Candidatus Eisenbacteria bacterium]
MTSLPVLLLIDESGGSLGRCRHQLEERARILMAASFEEGIRAAAQFHPQLIVAASEGEEGTEQALLGFCRDLHADPLLRDIPLVVVAPPMAIEFKQCAMSLGVDDFLARPVAPPDLLAKLQFAVRLARLQEERDAAVGEAGLRGRESLRSAKPVLQLLEKMLEMRIPGSSARARRVAALARRVAWRFEVPAEYLPGLEIGARLHALGHILVPPSAAAASGQDDEDEDQGGRFASGGFESRHSGGWQHILASRSLLREIPGMEETADMIGAIYENWDGTGVPSRMLRGQIPLRSRILRVLIDLFDRMDRPPYPRCTDALSQIVEQSGTRYDPMVVVHLQMILRDPAHRQERLTKARVHVTQLEEGMVLAEDLVTNSGVKLLSRGACLTQASIKTILGRQRFDPIVSDVVVHRPAA